MSESDIAVARNGTIIGRYTEAGFVAKIRAGEVLPSDHFWSAADGTWQAVSSYTVPATPRTVKITRVMRKTGRIAADISPGPPPPGLFSRVFGRFRRD